MNHNINFSQALILSSALFGSIYLNSVSMMEINKMFLNPNYIYYPFIMMNGFIYMGSSIILFSLGRKVFCLINQY